MTSMRRAPLITLGALLVVLPGGCPGPQPPADKNGIPAGVYSGRVQSEVNIYVDGELADTASRDTNLTETIDAGGRPLLSSGAPISEGTTLVLAEVGDNVLLATIDTITEGPGQLVLNYAIAGEVDGLEVSGTGQTTYLVNGDGSLHFQLSMSFSGTDARDQVIRQDEDQQGTLAP